MIGVAALSLMLFAAPPARHHCPPVTLDISGSKQFTKAFAPASYAFKKASANFAEAYAKACGEGLLKDKPLGPSGRLFLVNAPDANMGSIYATGGRTVFEFWFLTHDGKTHQPSAGQIHEALYCAAVGATPKEQQESGRCRPD